MCIRDRDVGGGVYRMVMSIGWNPFFDNSKKTIEPWLLHEFERDFYEQELRITVLGYVRPEANFTTIEDLIQRIHRDAEVAKTCLALDTFAVAIAKSRCFAEPQTAKVDRREIEVVPPDA